MYYFKIISHTFQSMHFSLPHYQNTKNYKVMKWEMGNEQCKGATVANMG